MLHSQKQIIDPEGLQRTIKRIAHELVERNRGVDELVLLGLRTRGLPLANRLNEAIKDITGKVLPVGVLDVTMYRDDVFQKIKQPQVQVTAIEFNIDGKTVVIVDDVLYTGRTIRAALDAIVDVGRPTLIQLAVLVDRGHRELPIRADYIGKSIPTSQGEEIKVKVKEVDDQDGVFLVNSTEEK